MRRKKTIFPTVVSEYREPDKYEGQCTLCGKKNIEWDYDGKLKPAPFGEIWCRCVGNKTTHTNIKKVKD